MTGVERKLSPGDVFVATFCISSLIKHASHLAEPQVLIHLDKEALDLYTKLRPILKLPRNRQWVVEKMLQRLLLVGELDVKCLAAITGLSEDYVWCILKVLEQFEVVTIRSEGSTAVVKANPAGLAKLAEALRSFVQHACEGISEAATALAARVSEIVSGKQPGTTHEEQKAVTKPSVTVQGAVKRVQVDVSVLAGDWISQVPKFAKEYGAPLLLEAENYKVVIVRYTEMRWLAIRRRDGERFVELWFYEMLMHKPYADFTVHVTREVLQQLVQLLEDIRRGTVSPTASVYLGSGFGAPFAYPRARRGIGVICKGKEWQIENMTDEEIETLIEFFKS